MKLTEVRFAGGVPRPDSRQNVETLRSSTTTPPFLELEYVKEERLIRVHSLRPTGKDKALEKSGVPVCVPLENVKYFW